MSRLANAREAQRRAGRGWHHRRERIEDAGSVARRFRSRSTLGRARQVDEYYTKVTERVKRILGWTGRRRLPVSESDFERVSLERAHAQHREAEDVPLAIDPLQEAARMVFARISFVTPSARRDLTSRSSETDGSPASIFATRD